MKSAKKRKEKETLNMCSREKIEEVIQDQIALCDRSKVIAKGLLRLNVDHKAPDEIQKRSEECESVFKRIEENEQFLLSVLESDDRYFDDQLFKNAEIVHNEHRLHLDWALLNNFAAFPSISKIKEDLGLTTVSDEKTTTPLTIPFKSPFKKPIFMCGKGNEDETLENTTLITETKETGESKEKKLGKPKIVDWNDVSDQEDKVDDNFLHVNGNSHGRESNDDKLSRLLIRALQSKDESSRQIKLPALALPSFGGESHLWRNYRNYCGILMADKTISQPRKLLAMQSSCHSEARDLIKNIITEHGCEDNSANIAWELLCKRYNNDRKMIAHEIENIFVVKQGHSRLTNNRKIFDAASGVMQNLIGIMKERENMNASEQKRPKQKFSEAEIEQRIGHFLFTHAVTRNFDTLTKLNMETYMEDKEISNPKPKDVLSFLEREIKRIETTRSDGPLDYDQEDYNYESDHFDQDQFDQDHLEENHLSDNDCESSRNVFNVQQRYQNRNAAVPYKCVYCKESVHRLYECPVFLKHSVKVKWNTVRNLLYCPNCL